MVIVVKSILNFIKGTLISCWVVIAIITTILLISFNDYRVSEFGEYSVFVVDNKSLEPHFKKNDIVIIKKDVEENYNIGDKVFFYLGNRQYNNFINLGDITDIQRNDQTEDAFKFGESEVSYSNLIGSANGAIVWHKIGFALKILESRWGFMFLIILPTLYAVVYEVYYIVLEVKKEAKKEAKKELLEEKENIEDEN